jgi:hypothetical protein
LTEIQLIQLHMAGSSFSYDYGLGDILQFILIQGGKLERCLGTIYGYLVLASPILIPKVTSLPFESKTLRLATKSTPLILRFNLRHIVFRIHLF